ncbi:hypothetical protein ACFFRR_011525 [Megaselia abdita]
MTRVLTTLLFAFFGLQIKTNAEKLKISDPYSYKHRDFILRYGTVFTQIGSETFADFNATKSNQCKPLVTYDLFDLERRFEFFKLNRFDVSGLENNLNDIYEHFGVSRISYLPYNFEFQSFERKDLVEANQNSFKMLTEITEMNNEKLTAKMSPAVLNSVEMQIKVNNKVVKNKIPLDRIKKYINLKTDVKIINSLKISFEVSFCVAELRSKTKVHKISYVPFEYEEDRSLKYFRNYSIMSLSDQKFKYALEIGYYDYFFLKDLDKECEVIGGILFCNIDYEKQIKEGECLLQVIKNINKPRPSCEINDKISDFTDLGNGKFYFLSKNRSLYEYTCDEVIDKGEMREGFVYIDNNCILSTAKTTIIGKDGFFKAIQIDNDNLVFRKNVIVHENSILPLIIEVILGLLIVVVLVFLDIYIYRKIRDYCFTSKKVEYDHLIDGMYSDDN